MERKENLKTPSNYVYPAVDAEASFDKIVKMIVDSKHQNIDRLEFAREVISYNLAKMHVAKALKLNFENEKSRLGNLSGSDLNISEKFLNNVNPKGLDLGFFCNALSHEVRHAFQGVKDEATKLFSRENSDAYMFFNKLTPNLISGPKEMIYCLIKAEDDAYGYGESFMKEVLQNAIHRASVLGDSKAEESLKNELVLANKVVDMRQNAKNMYTGLVQSEYLPVYYREHTEAFDEILGIAKDMQMGRISRSDYRLNIISKLAMDKTRDMAHPYEFCLRSMPIMLSYLPERSRVEAYINLVTSSPYPNRVSNALDDIVAHRVPITQNDLTKIFLNFDSYNRVTDRFCDIERCVKACSNIDEEVLAKTLLKTQGVEFAKRFGENYRFNRDFDMGKFDKVLEGAKEEPILRLSSGKAIYSPNQVLNLAVMRYAKSSHIEVNSPKYFELKSYMSGVLANIVDHFGTNQNAEFKGAIAKFLDNPIKQQFAKPKEDFSQMPSPLVPEVAKSIEGYIKSQNNSLLRHTSSGQGASISLGTDGIFVKLPDSVENAISKLANTMEELSKTISSIGASELSKFLKIKIHGGKDIEKSLRDDLTQKNEQEFEGDYEKGNEQGKENIENVKFVDKTVKSDEEQLLPTSGEDQKGEEKPHGMSPLGQEIMDRIRARIEAENNAKAENAPDANGATTTSENATQDSGQGMEKATGDASQEEMGAGV